MIDSLIYEFDVLNAVKLDGSELPTLDIKRKGDYLNVKEGVLYEEGKHYSAVQ